ncbi:MAG: sulfatase-like hydrolase/transferase [Myxococcales bacterium]|nr:MAG: sulfatase-like hydrolase/transferase [Myxococcales bacterium]
MRTYLRQFTFFLVLAAPAVVSRLLLVSALETDWTRYDSRGLCADLVLCCIIALLSALLGRRIRWLALPLPLLWITLCFINYEHAKLFDTVVEIRYAHYLFDPTFFMGSVSGSSLLLPWLITCLVALPTVWWSLKKPWGRWTFAGFTVLLIASTSYWLAQAASLEIMPWRQRNFLLASLDSTWTSLRLKHQADTDALHYHKRTERLEQILVADLGQGLRITPHGRGQNVIWLVLESVSGAYLPSFAKAQDMRADAHMPRLDAWFKKGLSFDQFIDQQRQTNRGSYALLCGDYPKLRSDTPKMSEYAAERRRTCLPKILAELGMHTVYMQSAPLGFMMKDHFMRAAGFLELHGYEHFNHAYSRNSWGPDDRAFLEQASDDIIHYHEKEQPFFVTLLNSGTHHPYNKLPLLTSTAASMPFFENFKSKVYFGTPRFSLRVMNLQGLVATTTQKANASLTIGAFWASSDRVYQNSEQTFLFCKVTLP